MAGGKVTRLSKIAREFNIGIHTIVDFLKEQGIEVDSNPNAKVEAEAYELLVGEFKSEKSAMEESHNMKNSRIDLLEEDPKEQRIEEEILITNVQGTAEEILPSKEEEVVKEEVKAEEIKAEEIVEEKVPEVEEEKKEEEAKPDKAEGLKVLGKIDLPSMNLKTRPDKKKKIEKPAKVVVEKEEVKEEVKGLK